MVEYGCAVTNKFGLMSDDDEYDDPQEMITRAAQITAERAAAQKKAETVAKTSVPVKEVSKVPVGKENSRPATSPAGGERGRGRGRGRGAGGQARQPRESAPADIADRFGENRSRGAPRGGRGGPRPPFRGRGGHANHNNEEHKDKDSSFEENRGQDAAPTGDFEGGRGRGAFTGERRGRGAFSGGERRGGRGGYGRGGARPFDRQSGSDRTGVRATEKKEGHGKGNWGNDKDELTGETEPISAPEGEQEPPVPEVPREKTAEELAAEAEAAELAKQKTLKEFKAALKKDSPTFNVRKAGEGESQNFGKLVPIAKEIINEKEEEEVTFIRKNKKQVLNIDIQFADTREQRGGRDRERGGDRDRPARGGRGGPRGSGRGGRGGSSRHDGNTFVTSPEAFPELGAK